AGDSGLFHRRLSQGIWRDYRPQGDGQNRPDHVNSKGWRLFSSFSPGKLAALKQSGEWRCPAESSAQVKTPPGLHGYAVRAVFFCSATDAVIPGDLLLIPLSSRAHPFNNVWDYITKNSF